MRPDGLLQPHLASSGLGGWISRKMKGQFCNEFLYVKQLILNHFGTSADQGPFWGSPGEVWEQIWNNIGELKWRRCQKVPCTLCDDLGGFVVVLLSRCRCVAVEASLPAMRWSDDIDFAWIPWQETLEHNVPWPCLWVLLLRCCCVVVVLLLRCCWSFPARYAMIWGSYFN